jgi:hemolysin D
MAPLPSSIPPRRSGLVGALLPRRQSDLITAPISAFESEVAGVIIRTSPYSEHAILHAIAATFIAVAVLASIVKVDEVVTSTGGAVATKGGPIYVQPLNQGIIHQIMVKPGDIVKKGDVLATLDPTFAAADENQLRERVASAQALIARLEAEQKGKPYNPPADADKYQQLQRTQWQQRQEEYKHSVAGFDAQMAATRSLIDQAKQDVVNYSSRLKYTTDIETMRTKLEKEGWGSRLQTNLASDARTEILRLSDAAKQQVQQQGHNLENIAAQRGVYVETWKDYLATNLVTARNDLDQASELLKKAEKVHELITLTSPEDAVVLNIASASAGSVVQSAIPNAVSGTQQPLFTLTPMDETVQAQLQIDADDIAFIRVGDPVTVKVDAFPYLRFGSADGVVRTISEGSFTQQDSGGTRSPFFKVWVEVKAMNFRNVPSTARLIPGMTLTGDIMVGKRTLMSYLVEGMLRNANEAMREP